MADSNITDIVVDVEGAGNFPAPQDRKDPPPEAETVSYESVGPEGQRPEEYLGTLSISPTPSWSTVTSNLLGFTGHNLETARDQLTCPLQGLLPPSQAPDVQGDSAVETSGGTPSELESQGTVRGGNPSQGVFKCTDIRTRGRHNREGMWIPPTLKSTPVTSVPTVTAFRPPRVGDELFSDGENGEDENGKDGNPAGERGEDVVVAHGDSEDSDGDSEYETPTNSPSRGGDKGKKLTSVKKTLCKKRRKSEKRFGKGQGEQTLGLQQSYNLCCSKKLPWDLAWSATLLRSPLMGVCSRDLPSRQRPLYLKGLEWTPRLWRWVSLSTSQGFYHLQSPIRVPC